MAQVDAGAHGSTAPGPSRYAALVISISGMVIFALLIGIVGDDISQKVDDLRKGITSFPRL
jgi:hypothetical protein